MVLVVAGTVPAVVLVVEPCPPPAGMEPAHPGNRTDRVKEPIGHPHCEKVMLDATRDPDPDDGVRTAVAESDDAGAS
jgi:hypothetical protein